METKVKRNNRRNFPVLFVAAVILMMVLSSNGYGASTILNYYYYDMDSGTTGDRFFPHSPTPLFLDLGTMYEGETESAYFKIQNADPSGQATISSATITSLDGYEFWSINPPSAGFLTAEIFTVTLDLEHIASGTFPSDTELTALISINSNDINGSPAEFFARATVKAAPQIEVTSPNGGEEFEGDAMHDITWTQSNVSNGIRIEYSLNGGTTWDFVDDGIDPSAVSYPWTVPYIPSEDCLIRIIDETFPAAFDQSDNPFTIKTQPSLTPPLNLETWVARYDGTGGDNWRDDWYQDDDEPAAIAVDATGNIYVTGYSGSNEQSIFAGFTTIKYDSDGNPLWTNKLEWGFYSKATAMAIDGSGNVYVTGLWVNYDAYPKIVTVKYDSDGNELWIKQYGPGFNIYYVPTDIDVDSAGNVYVIEYQRSNGQAGYDVRIISYDEYGDERWVDGGDGPQTTSYENSIGISVDDLGNVYGTWNVDYYIGAGYTTLRFDASSGENFWDAIYWGPTGGDDYPLGIAVDGLGNVIVTGFSDGGTTGGDYATIKYDSIGNQVWVARYDNQNSNDMPTDIVVDVSGNIYVTGTSSVSGLEPRVDIVTVKYDLNGNKLWEQTYTANTTGTKMGDVYLAVDELGNSYVTTPIQGGYTKLDYAVIQYDSDGNEVFAAGYNGSSDGMDRPKGIAVDNWGNIYGTGSSEGLGTGLDYVTVKYPATGGGPTIITESVTFQDDFTFTGDGITIGADDITIDGNGHTVSGDGSGAGIILNGKSNVTIKNLNISGFQRGIFVEGGNGHLIAKNSLANNSIAIAISSGDDHAIYYNIILDNETGVYVSSSGNQIFHNTLWNNEVQIQDAGGNSWHDPLNGYGNLWSNYWGEDTDGDFIGDTDLPHEGVDNAPILNPAIPDQYYPIYGVLPKAAATNDNYVGKRAWWVLPSYLVWRGGWSPVVLQVTDPLGRILSATENQIGLLAFYTEDETVVPDSKLAMIMISTDAESPLGDYSLHMTALEDLTYSTQWFASNASGILFHQSVENVPLVSGETQNITMTKTSDGVFPAKSLVTVILELIDYIENEGLHRGLENSLTSKLENVISKLEKGNEQAAVNQLGAFINQVEAKRGKKKGLSDEQADELISVAEILIDNINGPGDSAKRFASPDKTEIPEKFKLSHNSPNPFNPVTTIGYDIPVGVTGTVSLKVYDMRGALIRTLVDGVRSPGHYSSIWNSRDENGRRVSSGVYLYRLQADGFTETKKMILLR